MDYKIKDIGLAREGKLKVEWAEGRMPVLNFLKEKYNGEKPLKGMRIAGCIHVTKETAVLARALVSVGAEVSWSGCNPLSTQDDVAAYLVKEGLSVYAWHGLSRDDFYGCIRKTLEIKPTLTLDDGADLVFTIHKEHPEILSGVMGGTEETTTGVNRLRSMAVARELKYPIIAVNDSITKWDFDNVYGTGQSSIDGILRGSSVLIAGKVFVVAGYGHCGRGVAMRAKGMGARVIVTEVLPTAALKASLEGFEVMRMDEAASEGDIFMTTTGVENVIVRKHFEEMKDGAIVCNTGHYDCEINMEELREVAEEEKEMRENNKRYRLRNQRHIYVLADGRLVNLAAAEGHPSEVMDMSFANQFLALIRLSKEGQDMDNEVYTLSQETDEEVARLKLKSMGIIIDELTSEQEVYLKNYSLGT